MLLKGGTTKKKTFLAYPQSGPKLCPLPYAKRASDFEDLLDSVDRYEHPNGTNVTVREIYCRKYALGVFESKEPGQVKATKKTYFLEVQKQQQEEGKVKTQILRDISEQFQCQQSKGLVVKKGKYLILFNDEQSLHVIDLQSKNIIEALSNPIGRYDMQQQTSVKMFALKRGYFLIQSLKSQLYNIVPIPPNLILPGGPTTRIVCVREILNTEYQSTTNKTLIIQNIGSRKQLLLTEYTTRGKEKRLILLCQNFKTRKIKPLLTVMDTVKIYDVQMISKTKLLVTTMHCGVRVYLIDLKKRTQYEINWFSDTTKIRFLPGFDYKKRPLILSVRHDSLTVRNLQNFQVLNKLRDKISSTDGIIEPLYQDKEGVLIMRQDKVASKPQVILQRMNANFEYIVNAD